LKIENNTCLNFSVCCLSKLSEKSHTNLLQTRLTVTSTERQGRTDGQQRDEKEGPQSDHSDTLRTDSAKEATALSAVHPVPTTIYEEQVSHIPWKKVLLTGVTKL
jgi:hypothetical protein